MSGPRYREHVPIETEVMTLQEVCDYLRCHPSTVYRMLKRKELPCFKIGSDHRFLRSEIDQWIASHHS
jgi:excisionase family DNA binding protein